MIDFGVKLKRKSVLTFYTICGIFNIFGAGQTAPVGREFFDGVAVTHPDLAAYRNPLEERVAIDLAQIGPTVLAGTGGLNITARKVRQILCTITNRQQRFLSSNRTQIGMRGVFRPHRKWRAR